MYQHGQHSSTQYNSGMGGNGTDATTKTRKAASQDRIGHSNMNSSQLGASGGIITQQKRASSSSYRPSSSKTQKANMGSSKKSSKTVAQSSHQQPHSSHSLAQ